MTLGSFSKTIWDALRVGWLRADRRVIRQLASHPMAPLVDASPLDQAIAEHLLPQLTAIVAVRRGILRERRDHLFDRLRDLDGIEPVNRPQGGLSQWCRLERRSSARLVVDAAEGHVPRVGVGAGRTEWAWRRFRPPRS